ncbi:MAG: DUF302 domain-containing protein [Wenzhouxiangellaceae bacterium]
MKILQTTCAVLLLLITVKGSAAEGAIRLASAHDVATTAERLVTALRAKGMTVFAEIDHAAGAAANGVNLRPTYLVVFGNPKVGSPLMKCSQSVAIDLPQKALIWQDEDDRVWLSYNDPEYLRQRHAISGCDEVLGKISQALANFARAATAPDDDGTAGEEIFY